MGVLLEAVRISDAFTGPGESTDYLLANTGEDLLIEIDFKVELYAIQVDDEQTITARPPSNATTPVTTRLFTSELPLFTQFKVTDDIEVINTNLNDGTYSIVEKLDDNNIIVDSDLTNEDFPDGAYIQLTTPIKGVRYFYNFIENQASTSFISAIDGETQRFETNEADPNELVIKFPMTARGKKSWQVGGSTTIVGRGITSGAQRFTISHQIGRLSPIFLTGQFSQLVAGNFPPDYLNGNSPKNIFKIEAGTELTDPNRIQENTFDQILGNGGYLGENFNGNETNYFTSSFTVTRVSDGLPLSALQLDQECQIIMDIDNTVDSPFVDTATILIPNFLYLPDQEQFYQDNNVTALDAFFMDRDVQFLGAAGSAGELFGTDGQVFKSIDYTFISASRARLTINVLLSANGIAKLLARDIRRYMIYVAVADHTKSVTASDKANVLGSISEFIVDLIDTDLVSENHVFIQHQFTDKADGVNTLVATPVADLVGYQDFSIDYTDKESDGILFSSITNQIVLTHATEADIILENNTVDTSNIGFELGFVQNIDIQQDREFKIPDGDIRKVINITRNRPDDAGDTYNWINSYPFMVRWEYWRKITGVVGFPDGVFDPAQPFDGINHDWARLGQLSGWSIKHRVRFIIEQLGQTFEQQFDYAFDTQSYQANSNWNNEKIETFDQSSGSPLLNGSDKLIQLYTDTKVVATFEHTGTPPDLLDSAMELWIETKEVGGISDARRISSLYDIGVNSWFKSIDGSNKLLLEKSGNVYTGTALIDRAKLPSGFKEFTIHAIIYDKTPVVIVGKTTEGGAGKTTEGGAQKDLES